MKGIRMLAAILRNVVLVFFLLVLIGLALLYGTGKRCYVIQSGSMEPAIQVGSLSIVDFRYPFDEIKTGDIVCFMTSLGKEVTHRAIAITEEGIETKGDANDVSDGITTTEENYMGKNMLSIPKLGFLFAFLASKRGRIIIITAIICLLLFSFITKPDR